MTDKLDPAIVDMAIAWSIRLQFNRPSAEDERAFESWRKEHSEHETAWRRVQSMADPSKRAGSAVVLDALARAGKGHARRRRMLKTLAGVCAVGVVGMLAHRTGPWERATADYATAIGERRTIELADGTVVTLNTDAALDVRYGQEQRLLDLLRGEIYIATGKDAGPMPRPFLVRTKFGTLRARGARFFVRLDPVGGRLVVREGAVEVRTESGASSIGRAGETLRFDAGTLVHVAADMLDAGGWLDGVLSVRDMPLTRFLSELGRYRNGTIVCDSSVRARPVSGVYQTADTDKTLAMVASSLKLDLEYRTRYWVYVGPAAV